jgi:hypothetical protein
VIGGDVQSEEDTRKTLVIGRDVTRKKRQREEHSDRRCIEGEKIPGRPRWIAMRRL